MSMGILPACISVHHRLAWCPPEAGVASPVTGLTDGCEPPNGSWTLNLGPPEEEPVPFTPEPSLQSLDLIFILINTVCCYSETQLHSQN